MRILLAGAAAFALAASGAYAQGNGNGNGNGGGNGKDRGGGPPAAAQNKGGGNAKADRGPQAQQARGNGNGNAKADRGPDRRPVAAVNSNRGNGNGNGNRNAVRTNDRGNGQGNGNNGNANRGRYNDRGNDYRDVRVSYDGRGFWLEREQRDRGLVNGCPPGLAKKRNGCNPPGQVKDDYRRSLFGNEYRPSLFGLSNYGRGDYYYRDGYLVRYGDSGISGWLPLLGGALGIGNVWPSGYTSYDVPDYYVDYYGLGGPDRYRYADNVIYRVDPEDAAIMSVAALITGDEFSVGQPMPRGYDVYNVPAPYRARYYDTPESMYRYSDGYVYRVDPETRVVAAVIDLLT
ncbi:hypothetical protein K3179_08800 [Qipengyuania sp. GH38]|uniref:hypothetical protein n=1 Tax=Qipengyuania intermedia TaxID=2867244 RepID=UPI001C886601|nr:hypothetical protein [Qipengyuania intermedia]MBX7514640.1 hypothetical protein [Qipengyuania intermedia]